MKKIIVVGATGRLGSVVVGGASLNAMVGSP